MYRIEIATDYSSDNIIINTESRKYMVEIIHLYIDNCFFLFCSHDGFIVFDYSNNRIFDDNYGIYKNHKNYMRKQKLKELLKWKQD